MLEWLYLSLLFMFVCFFSPRPRYYEVMIEASPSYILREWERERELYIVQTFRSSALGLRSLIKPLVGILFKHLTIVDRNRCLNRIAGAHHTQTELLKDARALFLHTRALRSVRSIVGSLILIHCFRSTVLWFKHRLKTNKHQQQEHEYSFTPLLSR